MDGPPDGIAPQAWRRNGALSGRSHGTPTRRAERRFPATEITLWLLGALLWRPGRERFRELAIPREAVEECPARMIAAILLAEREFAGSEIDALWREDGDKISWGAAVEWFTPTDAEWAVSLVEWYAREYARRWMPAILEWIARELRAGLLRFDDVADELGKVLRLAQMRAANEEIT